MSDRPDVQLHRHTFPNGNEHRHAHGLTADHPTAVNDAHPEPYYFLCADCEPDRARIAQERSERAIAEEWKGPAR